MKQSEIDKQIQEFLAKGGKIQHIEYGVRKEDIFKNFKQYHAYNAKQKQEKNNER